MSEAYVVHCDHCNADITFINDRKAHRIRVLSENRSLVNNDMPIPDLPELDVAMNFFDLAHLKEWINAL
jgi:hypothetical protein